MAQFASGVTVVTASRDQVPHAMTATALCSLSLEPPLILVCVGRASRFHDVITTAASWCVSLLTADQEPLARHFSNRGRDLRSQFDGIPHTLSELGATPVLDGALAWMECTTYALYDGGDHTIVVGQIERAGADDGATSGPLTYHQGTYSGPPTT